MRDDAHERLHRLRLQEQIKLDEDAQESQGMTGREQNGENDRMRGINARESNYISTKNRNDKIKLVISRHENNTHTP